MSASCILGETESNIRNLFKDARETNSVIFFDEIDSIAGKRNSKGVMDRITSQLMIEMDSNCLVIGATNRLDLIDPCLLRSGRFALQLEIGLPNNESKLDILRALMRNLTYNFNLSEIDLTAAKSGADVYLMCCNSIEKAIKRQILNLTNEFKNQNMPFFDFVNQSDYSIEILATDFQ